MAACLAAQQNPDLVRDGKFRLTFIIIHKPLVFIKAVFISLNIQ